MISDQSIREPDEVRRDCAHKLRAVQVSSHFQASLGYLLDDDGSSGRDPGPEGWSNPRLRDTLFEVAT